MLHWFAIMLHGGCWRWTNVSFIIYAATSKSTFISTAFLRFSFLVSCFFPSGAGLSRVACHGPRGTPTTTAVDSSRGRAREGDRRAMVAGDNDILLTVWTSKEMEKMFQDVARVWCRLLNIGWYSLWQVVGWLFHGGLKVVSWQNSCSKYESCCLSIQWMIHHFYFYWSGIAMSNRR